MIRKRPNPEPRTPNYGLSHHLQKLIDLIVLAAHRRANLPTAVRNADRPQKRRAVEARERNLLHAVVRLHGDDAIHLRRARHHHVPLLRDAHVQVALRRHEVHLPGSALGNDLLEALRRGVHVEVLHLDLSVVRHLGLELLHPADLHGTHRDLELLAVPAHSLHDLHEALAQHPGADFLLQLHGILAWALHQPPKPPRRSNPY